MTDDLLKQLRGGYVVDYDEENQVALCKEAAARIEMLEMALDQLLDDMGKDGLCVCQAAKDQAIETLGKSEMADDLMKELREEQAWGNLLDGRAANRIEELESQLAASNRKIEELESQLAASNRKIEDLEDKIESLEYEICELENNR